MQRIGVLHLLDTLEAGGAEKVAVNLVNCLPRDRYVSYLCTTRREGPLAGLIGRDVGRLMLGRRSRYDVSAVGRLVRFVRTHKIRVLHAHGPALFIARAAAALLPQTAVIWHTHYGNYAVEDRASIPYRVATAGIGGVITVNEDLAGWVQRRLRVPAARVWYVPNPVCRPATTTAPKDLSKIRGTSIVCVANFRPEKDHFTLVRAMELVVKSTPDAYLLLVGGVRDPEYYKAVKAEIQARHLEQNISILGPREDVAAILSIADIAVLSSATEGLPMALLEYGMAGLPTVATSVGQAEEVLDYGSAGILVQSARPVLLAQGLLSLIRSPEQRAHFGEALRVHVEKTFGPRPVLRQICRIYDTVLGGRQPARLNPDMADVVDVAETGLKL